MYMAKQIKSIYKKMNFTMSCNNMEIENVVTKLINKYPSYSIKKLKSYIVKDSTYPLDIQLQKPFIAKETCSDNQNAYDKCLCGGRVKIANKLEF